MNLNKAMYTFGTGKENKFLLWLRGISEYFELVCEKNEHILIKK